MGSYTAEQPPQGLIKVQDRRLKQLVRPAFDQMPLQQKEHRSQPCQVLKQKLVAVMDQDQLLVEQEGQEAYQEDRVVSESCH